MKSNLWINNDTYNKLVIAGDSIGDVQCTDEEDNNFNTVEYYKTKEQLLESMIMVASEHKRMMESMDPNNFPWKKFNKIN